MLFTDVFSAAAVAVKQSTDPSNAIPFLGAQFFPSRKKMGVDLKWLKTHKGLGISLKPSALDSMATIRPRGGFKAVNEQMPLFRESMMITEQDLAEIQRAQDSNDPYLNEVLAHIYDDVNELVNGARISAERMRMSLLAPENGNLSIKIGMADNTLYNYIYDEDGEWKSSRYMEITSTSDKWNAPDTAKPLNDMQEAIDALADGGNVATYAIMNSVTLGYLIQSEQIQKLNAIRQYGVDTDFLDKNTTKRIVNGATGLTVLTYDKKYKDYDGTTKKYYPDGYVTIVGSEALGNTWFGVTPEERTLLGDPKVDVSVLDSGIAVAVQTIYGPPVQHSTTASQIALPSFEGMDSVYVLKVV